MARLDRIEAMLRQMCFEASPASLSIQEKAQVLLKAKGQGKAALKEAFKRINGQ